VALVVAMALIGLAAACGDDGASAPPPAEEVDGVDDTLDDPSGEVEDAAPGEGFSGYDDHVLDQYAGTSNWICHPDLDDDVCADISTTVIEPDGTRRVEDLSPAEEAGFDCFYAYPTTSGDPGPLSDLDVDESETDTVRAQVARLGSVCRLFAPAYRQVTRTGLGGGATPEDREVAYGDVLDAWRSYVVEANDGRGVVLIGHSQGAGHLRRILAEEIDPEPDLRARLVSAVLLGTTVAVPEGDGVGGAFSEIPACAGPDDTGCVISWSAYPAEAPPEEGAIFGRAQDEGEQALCVDPADLAGTNAPLGAVLPTRVSLLGGLEGFDDVDTPFVSLPGSIRTSCEVAGSYRYLAIELADPGDERPVPGLVEQRLGPAWGLHLLDANLAQDELIEALARQAEVHGR
jgi:hypothetical protein